VSTAARKLDAAPPATPVRPSRTAAARPPRTTPPHPDRRARRGSPFAFWVLVAVVTAVLVIGIASLSALFVQSSFSVDELRTDLGALEQQHESLREQVAAASSPHRVMAWARQRGMQTPVDVVILPLPPDAVGDGGAAT
jgi:cell division protein FtsL